MEAWTDERGYLFLEINKKYSLISFYTYTWKQTNFWLLYNERKIFFLCKYIWNISLKRMWLTTSDRSNSLFDFCYLMYTLILRRVRNSYFQFYLKPEFSKKRYIDEFRREKQLTMRMLLIKHDFYSNLQFGKVKHIWILKP